MGKCVQDLVATSVANVHGWYLLTREVPARQDLLARGSEGLPRNCSLSNALEIPKGWVP